MARSSTSFRHGAETPFLNSTSGVLASLSDQFGGLLDLQGYLGIAGKTGLIGSETKLLAETFETLDTKLSKQEKLTREDYMSVVDGLISLIEASFIHEDTNIETIRKAILQRILVDQDLHHKITSAFSIVEVISILLSTLLYAVNCTSIAPISTIPMLAGPYLQYKSSEPLHDHRMPVPKNYQLQLKHLEMVDKNEQRNPILHVIYSIAFIVSVNVVPYSYTKDIGPVNKTVETTSAHSGNTTIQRTSINEIIRGPYFLALGLCLQTLAAYLFLFQAKRNQKTMTKRTGILLPYLEKLPDKNQNFFLRTLDVLKTFKETVSNVESDRNIDEKTFYRLINTLNESLKKLEQEADPEIQGLFQQTTALIAKLRAPQNAQNPDTGSYPLLEYIRSRARNAQVQNLPAKWKNSENLGVEDTPTIGKQDIAVDGEQAKLEITKQIDFPKRMKQQEVIRFLEFMEGIRKERKGSHFSYEIPYEGAIYSVVLGNDTEYFGDTVRIWIIKSGLSPKYVLEKWQEFNRK